MTSRLVSATWKDSSSLIRAGRSIVTGVEDPPVATPAQSTYLVALSSEEAQENAQEWFFTLEMNNLRAWLSAAAASIQAQAQAPAQAPSGSSASSGGGAGGKLAAIRRCESGGNYSTNTGNGYYGAYQFSISTWQSLGYSGLPSQASPATQDQAAAQLAARSGWSQWPVCGG